jgi:hypothetical protein
MTHPNVLALNLLDLLAQVEAQLRCLTKIHRTLGQLAAAGHPKRALDIRHINDDLADVLTMNETIRPLCEDAIEAARKLRE